MTCAGSYAGASEPGSGQKPRNDSDVALASRGSVTPIPAPPTGSRRLEHRLDLSYFRPAGSGTNIGLARVEHVEVERDVHGVGSLERAVERVVDPRSAMNSISGGSRFCGPTSATSPADDTVVEQHS